MKTDPKKILSTGHADLQNLRISGNTAIIVIVGISGPLLVCMDFVHVYKSVEDWVQT